MSDNTDAKRRDVVFISKATPEDDEFVLWLGPKLEAAGYTVFADVLTLEPGDRWRNEITTKLRDESVKMLLCCRDTTLAKDGVREELGIGLDLAKSLPDKRFVMPLRLEAYKKIFGMGELQYIDFKRGWADGLVKLLEALKRQKIPCNPDRIQINPSWELYRRRRAVKLIAEPERLTSNWLRVSEGPDSIRFFVPKGVSDLGALKRACHGQYYPAEPHGPGFFTFAGVGDIERDFASLGAFEVLHQIRFRDFTENGCAALGIRRQEASNLVVSTFRQAWINYCVECGLLRYEYSRSTGFHVSKEHARIGQRIAWGRQGDRRSSMLRNVAKGHLWQFGVTAIPALWPFPHFKLKSRVLFAAQLADEQIDPNLPNAKRQHKLRRSVCKGWRNKQWHGRIMAFLELLSRDTAFIRLPLGGSANLTLDATPLMFTSPVRTPLPNELDDQDEEVDISTLGRPEPEDD